MHGFKRAASVVKAWPEMKADLLGVDGYGSRSCLTRGQKRTWHDRKGR